MGPDKVPMGSRFSPQYDFLVDFQNFSEALQKRVLTFFHSFLLHMKIWRELYQFGLWRISKFEKIFEKNFFMKFFRYNFWSFWDLRGLLGGRKKFFLGSKNRKKYFWGQKKSKNLSFKKRHFQADCGFLRGDMAIFSFGPQKSPIFAPHHQFFLKITP